MKISDSKHRIKELLDFFGDSQNEMARKSGLTKSAISNYINGSREPRQDALYYLSKAYNVNPAWLMGYDVPMDNIENIEKKMTKARLDFLDIDSDDINSLKENNDLFNGLREDYLKILSADGGTSKADTIAKALELYLKYENAIPEIQSAVDGLLKVPRQDS